MTNWPALDVAIGLSFTFGLLALVCTSVNEAIASVFNLRARNLEKWIGSVLSDPSLLAQLSRKVTDLVAQAHLPDDVAKPIAGLLANTQTDVETLKKQLTAELDRFGIDTNRLAGLLEQLVAVNEAEKSKAPDSPTDVDQLAATVKATVGLLPAEDDTKKEIAGLLANAETDKLTLREQLADALGDQPDVISKLVIDRDTLRTEASNPATASIPKSIDKTTTRYFYAHPTVRPLVAPPGRILWRKNGRRPSYLPAATFASYLIQNASNGHPSTTPIHETVAALPNVVRTAVVGAGQVGLSPTDVAPADLAAGTSHAAAVTAAAVSAAVASVTGNLPAPVAQTDQPAPPAPVTPVLGQVVTKAEADLRDQLVELRTRIEKWFDDSMDRASGWYKRRVQLILAILALSIAALLNADTIRIAESLWSDTTLRNTIVASASTYTKAPSDPSGVQQSLDRVNGLELPIGWTKTVTTEAVDAAGKKRVTSKEAWAVPGSFSSWISKVFGLVLTAFALMLGAPFWFDWLNRFVQIRGTGAKPAPKDHKASA